MTKVRLVVEDGVAILTLYGPESRNALDIACADTFVRSCDEIDADASVGAVIIRGEGPAFCSGIHRDLLAEIGRDPLSSAHLAMLSRIYEVFTRVGKLKPPTIAAINGDAVGAGLNLALATDLRVMAVTARMVSGFLRIGVHPGGGHFALVNRLAGREVAAAMGLFGAVIDGTRATQLGLAWEAVLVPEVDDVALRYARAVAQKPDLARRATSSLRLETGPPAVPLDVALEAERASQLWSLQASANVAAR
jgi:enoyl-CoA hydratase